jgi:hypothetical protein
MATLGLRILGRSWLPVLAAAAVAALAVAGYGQLLVPGEVPYSPHSDLVAYHLNAKTALHQSLERGQGVPFWRWDQFAGLPGLSHPQGQYTHPLQALFLWLAPEDAAGPTIFFLLVLGAAGFAVLGWVLGLGRVACFFLALAGLFQLKAVLAVYAGWLAVLPSIALLPWTFAAALCLMDRPGPGSALGLAATGGLLLHGGQIQLAYYAALFLGVYFLVRGAAQAREGGWRALFPLGVWTLSGLGIAVALAAYLLVPLVAEAGLVTRGSASYEFFVGNHALAPRHLLTFLFPEALGTPLDGTYPAVELWEDLGYFGLGPLLCAVLGAFWGSRRPHARFLIAGFLVSLLAALDTPLLRLLWEVLPGFDLFRCPSRLLFLTAVFGLALAGVGLEELGARARGRLRPFLVSALAVALFVAVALEGVAHARRYVTTLPAAEVLPRSRLAAHLSQDPTLFRVAPVGRPPLNPGWAAPWGLQLVTGFDSYNYDHYRRYLEIMIHGKAKPPEAWVWALLPGLVRDDLFNALNVKYIVAPDPLPAAAASRFELVARLENEPFYLLYAGLSRRDLWLYRNPRARPRAWWAERVRGVPDAAAMIAGLQAESIAETAWVLGVPSEFSEGTAGDRVEVESASPGRLSLRTHAARRRFLRVSEVWHPGWQGRLDGEEIPLHRADVALCGLWVPAGEHRVELHFQPPGWTIGLAATATGGALFLGLLTWFALQRLRARQARRG